MGDLPHRVPNDPRYFTADVHVTPDGRARIGGHDYTPAEYADMLRRAGYDGSKPVRLIGCDAASNDFAKQLSKHLDAPVLAPTKPAWTDASGRVFTSDPEIRPDGTRQPKIPPNGEWETHHPDGSKTRTGDDGYAPDTKHHDPDADTDTDGAVDRGDSGSGGDEVDWRDKPGETSGMSPREKIASKDYIDQHYYERPTKDGGVELVVNRHRAPDADGMEPPPVNLNNGKPEFKADRPPAESLGFDESRSTNQPRHESDSGDGSQDTRQDAYRDEQGWQASDDRAIDEKTATRQEKMQDTQDALRDTPKGSPERSEAIGAQTKASEEFGEQVSVHALRDRVHGQFAHAFPDAEVDFRTKGGGDFDPSHTSRDVLEVYDAKTGKVLAEITPMHTPGTPGHSNFDQVYKVDHLDGSKPDYVIHEAKAPSGDPSERKVVVNGETKYYEQGHPAYFADTLSAMERRGGDEALLAEELRKAKKDGRLDYVEVRAQTNEKGAQHELTGWKYRPYEGYDYKPRLPLR